jgi:muramidase (phage lysozyme)
MAIGDIRLRPGASRQQTTSATPAAGAFGEGVARAVGQLAGSLGEAADAQARILETIDARQKKQDRFAAEESYQRWVGELNRNQAELLRQAPADGRGVTNQTNDVVSASREEFLKGLPETVREEYGARTEGVLQNKLTSAFDFEFQKGNEYFRNETKRAIDLQAADILSGEVSYDEAAANIANLIQASDLPEAEQQQFALEAERFLAKATFQKEMEFARELKGTVREATGEDVVAAGLLPHERGVLNAISRRESGDKYNVRFGGKDGPQTFDDFSKHPGIMVERADGRMSSAAGRYQFTLTTWNQVAAELGLTDFSPESQDRAALHLARKIYNRQVGPGELTFDQVLQSGNRDLIMSMKDALTDESGGWEAFRTMSGDEFANIIMGADGISGGGTGSAELPDIWQDERFASLSFAEKNQLANLGAKQSATLEQQRLEQRQREFEAKQEEMFLAASQGGFQLEDEQELIRQNLLRSEKDVTRFRRVVNARAKAEAGAALVGDKIISGQSLSLTDNAALNAYLGDQGTAAVRELNTDYAQSTVIPIAQRAGYIPSGVAKELNSQILGNDPAARAYATDILSNIHASDPHALEKTTGLSKDAQSLAILAGSLRPYYTQEEINQRITDLRDPTKGMQVKQMRKDAGEYFDENITDSNLTSAFESWLPFDEPYMPLDPGQQAVFRNDMRKLFVEGFVVGGSEDGALDYARQMASQRWSVSRIGGENRMLRDSPERYYSSIEGSYDWIDQQVREELRLPEDATFQLVADGQTLMEGDRYRSTENREGMLNASYQVVVKNPDGTIEVRRGEDGMPLRFAAEVTPEMRNNIDRAAQYSSLKQRRDAIFAFGQAGGTQPEGAAEELEQINQQMRELEQGAPSGDVERIVPETPLHVLEEELARLEELQRQADAAAETDFLLGGMLAPTGIEELRALIAKRKENARR